MFFVGCDPECSNHSPTQFCYICVASGVCIVIVVHFVQIEKKKKKVLTVLFHELFIATCL